MSSTLIIMLILDIIILIFCLFFLIEIMKNPKILKLYRKKIKSIVKRVFHIKERVECYKEAGWLVWEITTYKENIGAAFIILLLFSILSYIIYFTPHSSEYIFNIYNFKEKNFWFWFRIAFFIFVIADSIYTIVKSLLKPYPKFIYWKVEEMIVVYNNGKENHIPYKNIKYIDFEIMQYSGKGIYQFYPIFYFYGINDKLLIKGEVLSKKGYILLREELQKHNLYYFEPSETMEKYDDEL